MPKIRLRSDNLGGCQALNIPYSSLAFSACFFGARVELSNVDSHYGSGHLPSLMYSGMTQAAFYVVPDTQGSDDLHRAYRKQAATNGWVFALLCRNPEVECLGGNYQVGKTRLSDFEDSYLKSVEANIETGLVYCESDDECRYGYQAVFEFAAGDAAAVNQAILKEIWFFVANRKQRPSPAIGRWGGFVHALKAKWLAKPSLVQNNKSSHTPLVRAADLLAANSVKTGNRKQALLEIAQLAVAERSTDDILATIRAIFETVSEDEERAAYAALGLSEGPFSDLPWALSLDWKDDYQQVNFALKRLLGARHQSEFEVSASEAEAAAQPHEVVEIARQKLAIGGLDMVEVNNETDTRMLIVVPKTHLQKATALAQAIDLY